MRFEIIGAKIFKNIDVKWKYILISGEVETFVEMESIRISSFDALHWCSFVHHFLNILRRTAHKFLVSTMLYENPPWWRSFKWYLGNDILIIKYSHRIMHNCLKLSQSNIVVCPFFTVFTFSHESNRLLNGIGFILSFLCPHYYMQ